MKKMILLFLILFLFTLFNSCSGKKDKPAPPPPVVKKEKSDTAGNKRGPVINVADTVERKMVVLCFRDSAATATGLSVKLNTIYNTRIPEAVRTAKLKIAGQPMAWYRTQKNVFYFEAGIPVDKAPAKAIKGMFIKKTGGDSALVAHFFGPTALSASGYEALNDILKDRKKNRSAPAYEVYVDNPFDLTVKKKDPYKMQMDIIVPYK